MTDPCRERVDLPGRPTDVWIGEGIRERVWPEVRRRFPTARRLGAVVDAAVAALWPEAGGGDEPDTLCLRAPAGEAAKERHVLETLQDALLELRREEPVIAVGGGAVLDVVGFAAATVRRGLPWIAVPTTVAGMADASVGGKVAINHPRGKNLLGTFHPPSLVVSDVDYLTTLEAREVLSGLAELYKVARIGDPALLALLGRGPPRSPAAWMDAIRRAVAVKARLVEQDERDRGPRRLLNYGHTVGHALERILGPERMRHGEAVAVGMAAAARLARARGLVGDAWVEGQDADLRRLGLDPARHEGVDASALLDVLGQDKKRRPGVRHVVVLPRESGPPAVYEDVEDAEIRAAWHAA